MNELNGPLKEAVFISKFLPVILLLVAIDFFIVSALCLFLDVATNPWMIFGFICFKMAFQLIIKRQMHRYKDILVASFLVLASSIQAFSLILAIFLPENSIIDFNVLFTISSLTSSILFLSWGIIIAILRANFLSSKGFLLVVVLFFISLRLTTTIELPFFVILFSNLPILLLFLWIWATRKALFIRTNTTYDNFAFFLGYGKSSTGMKN